MNEQNYTTTLLVDQSPEEVFKAITDVRAWWSQDFNGHSEKINDEFDVRFADVHYSRQRLIEVTENQKIVWLVTESNLSFIKEKSEWNNTTIHFEIFREGSKTKIVFTHQGLVPQVECFSNCSKGWNYYLNESLLPFITTGEGKPNLK